MKTIGIYVGQFQPPHKGHFEAYKKLRGVAGPDTFVVTTDYDPTLEAALHFGDKEQVLVRHGIDASHIRKVRNLNNPTEVLENFDPETTIIIYALNAKEAKRKLSISKYYQPISSTNKKLPYKSAAYILPVNDDLVYKGKVYTSKNIREALGSHRFTTHDKKNWFKHFFGWFDLGLFELLKNKYENAHTSADGAEPEVNIKEEITKEICNILNELMGSPPSVANQDSTDLGDTDSQFGDFSSDAMKSNADKAKEDKQNRQDLIQQKKQAEDEKKMHKRQYDRDKSSAYTYDKYTKKQDQQKLDTINKSITQSSV